MTWGKGKYRTPARDHAQGYRRYSAWCAATQLAPLPPRAFWREVYAYAEHLRHGHEITVAADVVEFVRWYLDS